MDTLPGPPKYRTGQALYSATPAAPSEQSASNPILSNPCGMQTRTPRRGVPS